MDSRLYWKSIKFLFIFKLSYQILNITNPEMGMQCKLGEKVTGKVSISCDLEINLLKQQQRTKTSESFEIFCNNYTLFNLYQNKISLA